MKIDLIDNYVLTSDSDNFILNEKTIVKSGKNKDKEVLIAVGYWPTIVQLLDGLITKKMLQSNARTVEGLIRDHKALISECKKLLGTIN